MTALKVIGIVLLILLLIGLIRVGGIVEYSAEGVRAWARVGALRIRILPMRPRKKKKEKKPKKKKKKGKPGHKKENTPKPSPQKQEEEGPKAGGPLELVKRFLPLVGEAAGALKRRIRVDDLELFLTVGGRNAAKTAMTFGYSNAVLGMLWPIFEQNFQVKDYRVRTAVDFTLPASTVWIRAAISLRISQAVSFAVVYGVKFLKAYFAGKKEAKTQKG